jgi:NADH-quinone oxidoreductase subunit M
VLVPVEPRRPLARAWRHLANLALGVLLWAAYDIGGPQWQFQEFGFNFGAFRYTLGIDGIALMLILLSVFLMPICIAASWSSIEHRIPSIWRPSC